MLYKARNSVIEFLDDLSSVESKVKLKATKETRLKISTPKQMFQKLPMALAQVKAGNNSESLLKLFILCINQKKLLKKYTIA